MDSEYTMINVEGTSYTIMSSQLVLAAAVGKYGMVLSLDLFLVSSSLNELAAVNLRSEM